MHKRNVVRLEEEIHMQEERRDRELALIMEASNTQERHIHTLHHENLTLR
jgi:hypothetical protein